MHVSLNEIDAQVRKAARGAGLTWGQAEEAGKVARKLVGHGLDVLPALADLVEDHASGRKVASTVARRNGAWRGVEGPLSPLVLGPIISDRAAAIGDGREIVAGPVVHPILLIPFVTTVARVCGRPIEVRWPDGRLVVGPDGAYGGDVDRLSCVSTLAEAVCRLSGDGPLTKRLMAPAWTGACVSPDLWARFDRLARLTYVPASDQSRQGGAGAGAIDND